MVALCVRLIRFYLAWNARLQELVFVATPMTCQQFQHSPSLFGDCEVYGVWPTKNFYAMLLWPLRVFSRVFLVRAISDQRKYNHNLYILSCTRFLWKPFSRSCLLWLFKYARDGEDRLMGDLDVETAKNFCNSLGKCFGMSRITKPRWSVSFISCCLLSWRPSWMKLAG